MDFAWVVDALRRGLRVTRKAWAGDPPMYLYMVTEKKPDGKHIIRMNTGTGQVFEWTPTAEQMLIVDDWEEYVEPKKKPVDKLPKEDLPIWPEVNADGYARMCKGSDVIIHDGVYRSPKKKPVFGNTKLSFDENGQPHMGDTITIDEYQRMHGGTPVKDNTEFATGDLAAEDWQAHLLGLLVDSLANQISQRVVQLLQKTVITLSKED